jgi:hypothetical protein
MYEIVIQPSYPEILGEATDNEFERFLSEVDPIDPRIREKLDTIRNRRGTFGEFCRILTAGQKIDVMSKCSDELRRRIETRTIPGPFMETFYLARGYMYRMMYDMMPVSNISETDLNVSECEKQQPEIVEIGSFQHKQLIFHIYMERV